MIPKRLKDILLKNGYGDSDIDWSLIAQTKWGDVHSVMGIGPGYLNLVAQTLEKKNLIDAGDWLSGDVVIEQSEDPPAVEPVEVHNWEDADEPKTEVWEDEPDPETLSPVARNPNEPWEDTDVLGPHRLSDEVLSVVSGLTLKDIVDKIESEGLGKYWTKHLECVEAKKEATPEQVRTLNEIINITKYRASLACGRVFSQGHWRASVAYWIYLERTDKSDPESHAETLKAIPKRIELCQKVLARLGYKEKGG